MAFDGLLAQHQFGIFPMILKIMIVLKSGGVWMIAVSK